MDWILEAKACFVDPSKEDRVSSIGHVNYMMACSNILDRLDQVFVDLALVDIVVLAKEVQEEEEQANLTVLINFVWTVEVVVVVQVNSVAHVLHVVELHYFDFVDLVMETQTNVVEMALTS